MENRRGVTARIGLTLLNFIAPGLGLLRSGDWNLAVALYSVSLAALLFFYAAPVVPFAALVLAASVGIGSLLAALLFSWRRSRIRSTDTPGYSRWYGVLGVAIVAVCINFLLTDDRRRNYRIFYTPAESMLPTFPRNDRFIAFMGPVAPLRRGDLVLVQAPSGDTYIKRVAALGGDRFSMTDGIVALNGIPVSQRRTRVNRINDYLGAQEADRLTEQFPDEPTSHEIYDLGPSDGDDVPELIVPAGSVFVLGDNRDRSADSRYPTEFGGLGGPVLLTNVVGRPLYQSWGSSRPLGTKLFNSF